MLDSGSPGAGITRIELALSARGETDAGETSHSGLASDEHPFALLLALAPALEHPPAEVGPLHVLLSGDVGGLQPIGPPVQPGSSLPPGGGILPPQLLSVSDDRPLPGVSDPKAGGWLGGRGEVALSAQQVSVVLEQVAHVPRRPAASGQTALEQHNATPPAAPTSARASQSPAVSPSAQAPLSLAQPGFDQALAQRLVVMVQQGSRHASIHVHPEHLGPIKIRLQLDGDTAHLTFVSPHAAVREALELAVPRLRELLEHAGVDLAQVDVGAHEQPQAENSADQGAQHGRSAADAGTETDETSVPPQPVSLTAGLVDLYA